MSSPIVVVRPALAASFAALRTAAALALNAAV